MTRGRRNPASSLRPGDRVRARSATVVLVLILTACGPAGDAGIRERAPAQAPSPAATAPEFVGGAACARCHAEEAAAWRGSHHDLAMQEVSRETVLGEFDDVQVPHDGAVATFRWPGEETSPRVRTVGPGGTSEEFPVAYVFGFEPLQQLLLPLPGGRLQALGIPWDARSPEAGGGRWYDLYPEEELEPGDPLHWTGRLHNWNSMCAECHSTGLRKGYDVVSDTFDTTWEEIDVACEACHGPGSAHVRWAEARQAGEPVGESPRMAVALPAHDPDAWRMGPRDIALRVTPGSGAEVEACGRCHARRTGVRTEQVWGRPLTDTHRVALLEEDLYFADGQIRDEVYVYGSFLQSRMHRGGVTCSDCHDAHATTLRAEGDALCTRCHLAERFDAAEHDFHPGGGPGSRCVDCHMPAREYMVVDPRRDHSFPIPRPEQAARLGLPDVCSDCHPDSVPSVPGGLRQDPSRPEASFAGALVAARRGDPDAPDRLLEVVADAGVAGIVRATALAELDRFTVADPRALAASLEDPDPLVRIGALRGLGGADAPARLRMAMALVGDSILTVRLEAFRAILSVPPEMLSPSQKRELRDVADEYRRAQRAAAEHPEAHLALAELAAWEGEPGVAEQELQAAVRLAPEQAAPYVNLADLYRRLDREAEGESWLRRGLEIRPDAPPLHHALGLLLARTGRAAEGREHLARAAALDDAESRYAYVYAVALHGDGETPRALEVLDEAVQRDPGDAELHVARTTIARDAGMLDRAADYARRFAEAHPRDPRARSLLRELVGGDG